MPPIARILFWVGGGGMIQCVRSDQILGTAHEAINVGGRLQEDKDKHPHSLLYAFHIACGDRFLWFLCL